jgi:hypothetical protein
VNAATIIVLGSFLLSVLTFISVQIGGKRTATATYVQSLEKRIEVLEQQLGAKTIRVQELEELNIRLTQRLIAAGG